MKKAAIAKPKARRQRAKRIEDASPAEITARRLMVLKKKYARDTLKGDGLQELRMLCPELFPAGNGYSSNGSSPHLPPDISPPNPGPNSPIPLRLNKQTDLARFLQEKYGARVAIHIGPQTVDDWKSGVRLPEIEVAGEIKQAPPMPNKDANGFFPVQEICQWFEAWILPSKGVTGSKAGKDLRTRRAEHEIWEMDRQRAIADGSYKPAADFLKWIDRIREVFKTAVMRELEGTLVREVGQVIDGLSLAPETAGPAKVACQESAKKVVDTLLATWSREVREVGNLAKKKEPELPLNDSK